MPSRNHAYIQMNFGALFKTLQKYTVYGGLSLEINGKEYLPNVSVYPKREVDYSQDVIKEKEMPLLAIEILSPTQGMQELVELFQIYFGAGIRSCWLVQPYDCSVMVWLDSYTPKTFIGGYLFDSVLNLTVPLETIFD